MVMSVGLYAQETESRHSQIKVKKILESKSVKEYNQWVTKNIAKYPGLKAVLVDYTGYYKKSPLKRYEINYYTERGDRLSSEVIEDSQTEIYVPVTNDRVLIYKPGSEFITLQTTVKNSKGETILTVPYGISYIGMGIYIESKGPYAGPEPELKILNKNGQIIGTLKQVNYVDRSCLCIANDKRYTVFAGGRGDEGKPVILITREGKELWRQTYRSAPVSLIISEDGSKIGIHHGKFVSVYLEDGSLLREYNPFDKVYGLSNAFSENGNRYASGYASNINYYDNTTGDLLWKNDTTLAENNDEVRFLGVMDDGEIVIVLCWSHNLYVFDKEGHLRKETNLELGKEWFEIPPDPKHGRPFAEKIEGVTRSWFAEFVGDYVIITKGRIGTRDEPLTRIIHKIVFG